MIKEEKAKTTKHSKEKNMLNTQFCELKLKKYK